MRVSWEAFKNFVDSKGLSIQFVEVYNHYWLKAYHGPFELTCVVDITDPANASQIEFEAGYKDDGNKEIVQNVGTKFERDDIVLKLARVNGQADENGDLQIVITVPGSDYRYVAGGYAYVENYNWADALTKVEVVDTNNLFGYGAGVVVKNYHDTEVSSDNQGWFFEKSYGAEGNVDIEPMGWYGALPSGLDLKITFKVQANVRIKAMLWWGKVE